MSDPDQTLQSIDDTLEQWDEWDGNSPDAARWAGGPNEGEWPEGPTLEESWRRIVEASFEFADWFERHLQANCEHPEMYAHTPMPEDTHARLQCLSCGVERRVLR